MIRRSSRVIQTARDAVVLLLSIVLVVTSYGKWATEPVFLVIFSIFAILFVLTVVNEVLIVLKVNGKGYFRANSVFQLIIGLFMLGLVPVIGVLLLSLNIAAIVSLRERKSPEERLRNPPVKITRGYRMVVGIGLLTMLISMFIPALSTPDASASVFAIYAAIATHSSLPSLSIAPSAVIFALLGIFLPPLSLVSGGLGMIRRRFSLASGALSILAGASLVVVLTASTGPGAYGFVLAGILFLLGYFAFRLTKSTAPAS